MILQNIRKFLIPISWIYGLIVWIRNRLFDSNILKKKEFTTPIISVGNITVGGTGKTPHIEYIIEILCKSFKIAVISRGYKRKTKGLFEVKTNSSPKDIGDEPLQIKQKYPQAKVFVCEKRKTAISHLLNTDKKNSPDVILLDDAFQHRYITPSLSILLMDINRPIYEDNLLPAGNLREQFIEKNRANIIIVTKCESNIKQNDRAKIEQKLNLNNNQSIFFSTIKYQNLLPVFYENKQEINLNSIKTKHALLVTGIASNKSLINKLKEKTSNINTLSFPDHHFFNKRDIQNIILEFNKIRNNEKIIIFTEKDAVRLKDADYFDDEIKKLVFYLPIKIELLDRIDQFNKYIINHVREN